MDFLIYLFCLFMECFILNFNRLFVNDSKKYSAYSEA